MLIVERGVEQKQVSAMANQPMAQYIDQYRNEKLSFIPIPAGAKKAIIKWECYQERQPNDQEVADWKSNGTVNLAIICGKVSGNLIVLDFDSHERFHEYCALLQDKYGIDLFNYTRIVRTSRGNHVYFRLPATMQRLKFPKLDIQAEGNYVIAPPSIHPSGSVYECINQGIPIRQIESLKDVGIDVTQVKEKSAVSNGSGGSLIPEGQRNSTLTSLAGTMRRRGMSQEAIFTALMVDNRRCQPPLPENEVRAIAESVSRYVPLTTGYSVSYKTPGGGEGNIVPSNSNRNTERNTNATENATTPQQESLVDRVRQWIESSGSRWFETPELDRDLGIASVTDKNNRREIMLRLLDKESIERHAKEQKRWRFVNKQLVALDFKNATNAGALPIKWPLKIHEYVNLFPGNLVVVAGATNAGKTALLLNVVYLNQFSLKLPIYYFCSEMGEVELRERLEQFDGLAIQEWNFKPFDRSTDFADVIAPDCLNMVDYLEMTDDLFAINSHLTAITRKLGNGLAIVAIQKKVNAKFGRGQEFSAEKSKLYLSMDETKITIVKGKSWVNKKVNPNGLSARFNLLHGSEFEMTQEWERTND